MTRIKKKKKEEKEEKEGKKNKEEKRGPCPKIGQVDPLKVLYTRSPGRDPVLKVDRLTRVKKGPCFTGLPVLKVLYFPIAGKGPCTEGGQVDPY